MQRMVAYTLRHGGYTVYSASSGPEALALLPDMVIDVVITDMSMPEMDGLELLRQLRADERYRSLPVLMLTGSADERDRAMACRDGANVFLTKPAVSRELLDAVGQLLRIADCRLQNAD
jgi:CheY-like chemotaxis protein